LESKKNNESGYAMTQSKSKNQIRIGGGAGFSGIESIQQWNLQ